MKRELTTEQREALERRRAEWAKRGNKLPDGSQYVADEDSDPYDGSNAD